MNFDKRRAKDFLIKKGVVNTVEQNILLEIVKEEIIKGVKA